jgi:hypothetical protein
MTKPDRRPVPDLPPKPDIRRLHDATDRLNESILEFEKALSGLKLGVSGRVILDEDERGWYRALCFAKSGGQFKLLIESGVDDDPDVSVTPLVNSSREIRLEAVAAFKKLYHVLLGEFESEIERVNASIETVDSLAEDLRAKARE